MIMFLAVLMYICKGTYIFLILPVLLLNKMLSTCCVKIPWDDLKKAAAGNFLRTVAIAAKVEVDDVIQLIL